MAVPAKTSLNRRGFTLIELMVVVLIILLISAALLPTIIPALEHREISEAGRLLQGGLVQARSAATKHNAPRGLRLLSDPTYANSPSIVAFNRWTFIEPGPDYSNGSVVIWPVPTFLDFNPPPNPPPPPIPPRPFSAEYPIYNGANSVGTYPYMPISITGPTDGVTWPGQVLMVEEAPFTGNSSSGSLLNPTSWFWNIRIGDQIQIGDSGRKYTIIGPMTINPFVPAASPLHGNPEMFVNDGLPGVAPRLVRPYNDATGMNQVSANVEYLYLVNSVDDDANGFIDDGWDGFNNNYNFDTNNNPWIDDLFEWTEVEQWLGSERSVVGGLGSYTAACINSSTAGVLPVPSNYTISRRPVVSPGAQETSLPTRVVIDATSWNSTAERSRLPIDATGKFCDILLNPNGQAVLQTIYSSPASAGENATFYHFWLSERQDVQEVVDHRAPPNNVPYVLPMPAGTTAYPNVNDATGRVLKGERLLVTLFGRTGQVTTNSVEFFNAIDTNTPFYDSQLGAREAK